MKKIILFVLIAAVLLMTGCGSEKEEASDEIMPLSFANAVSFDTIKSLDGKSVSIIGYMATLSPVSGNYIYLMNMPYQSCPFCVPNTSQLSNTMAVYAPEGKTFEFTDQAVKITGTMEVNDFTDDFGYEYNYRIKDAEYKIVDLSEMDSSPSYALWQALAAEGIVADVNSMFDYVHFVCQWTEYSVSYTDDDGNDVFYYLYPGDVSQYLTDEGIYGYADKASADYFPSLIERCKAISENELDDLIAIIEKAHEVEIYARENLENEEYEYNEEEDKFHLINNDDLYDRWYEVYCEFSDWLAKWSM